MRSTTTSPPPRLDHPPGAEAGGFDAMLLRCVEEVQPAAIRHPPAGARAHSARWPSIKSRFAKTWTSQKATFGSGCRPL